MTLSNPFPNGIVQPSGNTLGLLTGAGGDICFVDPNKGAPKVQQYRPTSSASCRGGMSLSVGYTGLTGTNLSWGGTTRHADQHQPARSEVP